LLKIQEYKKLTINRQLLIFLNTASRQWNKRWLIFLEFFIKIFSKKEDFFA